MVNDFLLVSKTVIKECGRNCAIIYAMLKERFGDDPVIEGIKYIEGKVDLSVPTIRACFETLEKKGLIAKVSYRDRSGYVYEIKDKRNVGEAE